MNIYEFAALKDLTVSGIKPLFSGERWQAALYHNEHPMIFQTQVDGKFVEPRGHGDTCDEAVNDLTNAIRGQTIAIRPWCGNLVWIEVPILESCGP
jgi:hypothetical protein